MTVTKFATIDRSRRSHDGSVTRQRDDLRQRRDDHGHLQHQPVVRPPRAAADESRADGDPESAFDEQHVDEQQPARAGRGELVDDDRVDQVVCMPPRSRIAWSGGPRRPSRATRRSPGPRGRPVGLREERLSQAGSCRRPGRRARVERVLPCLDAVVHVPDRVREEPSPRDRRQPRRREDQPVRRHVQSIARNPRRHQRRPRSRMKTSVTIATPHTRSSGPRCLCRGIVSGPTLRCTSSCRVSRR